MRLAAGSRRPAQVVGLPRCCRLVQWSPRLGGPALRPRRASQTGGTWSSASIFGRSINWWFLVCFVLSSVWVSNGGTCVRFLFFSFSAVGSGVWC